MNLADRLKQARKAADMTQAELASVSGVTQAMISKLELGKSRATSDIIALADALGVSPHWLAKGKDAENERERTLSSVERELLDIFRSLPPKERAHLLAIGNVLASTRHTKSRK